MADKDSMKDKVDAAKTVGEATVSAVNRIMEKLSTTRTHFLDKAIEWWFRRLAQGQRHEPLPADPNNSAHPKRDDTLDNAVKKAARMKLFGEIELSNRKSISRLEELPAGELRHIEGKIKELCALQREVGFTGSHPSVLAEHGRALLSANKLASARRVFGEAVDILSGSADQLSLRDLVFVLGHRARCNYLLGDHAKAEKDADQALKVARGITRTLEEELYLKNDTAPIYFRPALMQAYYIQMDIRVNHPRWKADGSIQKQFNYYWRKSSDELMTPKQWHPITKIAIISDDRWFERLTQHVTEVIEQLYVEMADNASQKWLREARVFWWDFLKKEDDPKDPHHPSKKLVAAILFATVAIPSNPHPDSEGTTTKKVPAVYARTASVKSPKDLNKVPLNEFVTHLDSLEDSQPGDRTAKAQRSEESKIDGRGNRNAEHNAELGRARGDGRGMRSSSPQDDSSQKKTDGRGMREAESVDAVAGLAQPKWDAGRYTIFYTRSDARGV